MAGKSRVLVSLGTFQESEAREIARQLTEKEGIHTVVENLSVDSGPTTWWHVSVPFKHSVLAGAWVKGYRFGRSEGRDDMRTVLANVAESEVTP